VLGGLKDMGREESVWVVISLQSFRGELFTSGR
jgi:hypothetical protein